MSRGPRRVGKPPRIPIFRFGEPPALDQLSEIDWIVRGQDGRWKLEAIDHTTADVIPGIIERAHHFSSAFVAKPTGRSAKKRSRYVVIVNALEQAETAYIR